MRSEERVATLLPYWGTSPPLSHINEHYKGINDSDWIRSQLVSGGMLSQHPQKSVVDNTIADLTTAGRYTNDRVVSSVTFGFWTYLFTKKPFRLGGQSLLKIFPAKATGLGQPGLPIGNFRI